MSRDNRPAWRKVLDAILDDPEAALKKVREYFDDVRNGADPIEALHGHVCSPDCWHGQMGAAVWPALHCIRCGCRSFEVNRYGDRRRCLRCGKEQSKERRR